MQNPKLKPFGVLIGEWNTIGKHRLLPGVTLHSHVSFEWVEDGAYLRMRSQTAEKEIPSAITLVGSDDASEAVTMLYFDVRGVSRIFEATLTGNVLKYWRNAPGFSQRNTWTFIDNNTIQAVSELSEDDKTWMRDLEQTYTRVQ